MFIRRFQGEIIFHLFSLIFFDLIYFIVLMMLLVQENLWLCLTSLLVFGHLHLQYFRNFCRKIRWPLVMPHIIFPTLLSLIAFLTYTL
jgi:hypothetical protein